MTDLTTEEKTSFLADVMIQVERICKYYKHDIDDDLLKDLSKRICRSNLHYDRRTIIQALEDFYTATIEYFTPMEVLQHTNERVCQIARKALEDKKKLEQEKYYQELSKVQTDDKVSSEVINNMRSELKEPEKRTGQIKAGELIRKRYGW